MAVYVDTIRKGWCHMMTDGDIQELHDMATKIGVGRWFQDHPLHPHYDLRPSKRILAIRYGAIEVTPPDLVMKCSKYADVIKARKSEIESNE